MTWGSQLAGRSVLVTGGSGFIGAHLCQRLISCDAEVSGVSRRQQSKGESVRWCQADLCDIVAVRQVFSSVRPDVIFHLASHVVGARNIEAVLPTFYNNLSTTVILLTVAMERGCQRVVLASSSEEPLGTDNTAVACSPYAASKWASSIYGRMFYELFGLPVVMPRIFMTYGPDQKDVQKLVPFVVNSLIQGKAPRLSSGRRRADWIYVGDVVEGLLRSAVVPGIEGCAFDLGTGSLTSVREIVEQIAHITGSSVELDFNALPDRQFEQERPADTTFLMDKLEYRPGTSLRLGLETTIAWHRQELEVSAD